MRMKTVLKRKVRKKQTSYFTYKLMAVLPHLQFCMEVKLGQRYRKTNVCEI